MRVVFMGTPDFAVGTLKAIIEAGHDVAAVVTQPDKPRGRSKSLVFSPVKDEAVRIIYRFFSQKEQEMKHL